MCIVLRVYIIYVYIGMYVCFVNYDTEMSKITPKKVTYFTSTYIEFQLNK